MRWIRYSAGSEPRFGILEDDKVVDVEGSPFDQYRPTGLVYSLADVKLEVPVIPRTFYCAGLNYTAHVLREAEQQGIEANIPKKADIGYRANNALIAHDDIVRIPGDATEVVQYEGELVVVIGQEAKHLTEEDALSCVLGYTIGNDVSERSWLKSDRTFWRAKNTDTFKPMGPWIETDVDLEAMITKVSVNGEETTRFQTNAMLFGIRHFIATMTRYLTLYSGDVIWMGTDGASPNLKSGDLVEIEITGIGTLRNRFERQIA